MKSLARSFILLGLAVSTGCATVHPVTAFDRLDASPRSDPAVRDSGANDIQPGVLGAGIGAVVGGALGAGSSLIHCDNGVCPPPVRATLTGAAIGAIVGLFIEWFVRSDPLPLRP